MGAAAVVTVLLAFAISAAAGLYREHQLAARHFSGVRLSNHEEIASSIREGLKNHSRQITVRFTAHSDSMSEISGIAGGLLEEALSETDDPAEGDYIRFQYGGYEVRYGYNNDRNKYHYVIRILPDYYTTVEQEETVTEEIQRVLESFAFDEMTSDYEKVRTVYDYIYQNVSYDKVHKNKENQHLKTTAYSALIYKTAVCQGYSVLMYRMLREAGVSVRVITGTASFEGIEEFHAWNIVRIDDKYYNLDATWDKALETEDYFLKSDADFTDHIRDEQYRTEEFYRQYPMAKHNYKEG